MVTYLSEPMIRAYTTGSAFLVCVSQLKDIFGVALSRYSGPLSVVYVSRSGQTPPRDELLVFDWWF